MVTIWKGIAVLLALSDLDNDIEDLDAEMRCISFMSFTSSLAYEGFPRRQDINVILESTSHLIMQRCTTSELWGPLLPRALGSRGVSPHFASCCHGYPGAVLTTRRRARGKSAVHYTT